MSLKDAFARRFSFSGYEEMLRYSKPVLLDGDSIWYVTEGQRKFLVWDEVGIEDSEVLEFADKEAAYLYVREILESRASTRTPMREVVIDDPRHIFREHYDVITKLKQTLEDEIGFVPEGIYVEHGSYEVFGQRWLESHMPLKMPFFEDGLVWEYEVESPGGIVRKYALDSDFIFLLSEAKLVASRRVYVRDSQTFDAVSGISLDDNFDHSYSLEEVASGVGWVLPAEEYGEILEGWMDGWQPLYHHPTYPGRHIFGNGDLVGKEVEIRRVGK